MNPIQQMATSRGITRLCHFTQSRNLAHIFGDTLKLLSTKTLFEMGLPYNFTDLNRYDGKEEMICCSIEYPNPFYFYKAKNKENLFRDWVVLLINHEYLWDPETFFCPCNASISKGAHIKVGFEGFRDLYSNPSSVGRYSRNSLHLNAVPTDLQAEVLLKDPLPLTAIIGIVVVSKEQAKLESFRLRLQGISMDIPFIIVPDFFDRDKLRNLIMTGNKPKECMEGTS